MWQSYWFAKNSINCVPKIPIYIIAQLYNLEEFFLHTLIWMLTVLSNKVKFSSILCREIRFSMNIIHQCVHSISSLILQIWSSYTYYQSKINSSQFYEFYLIHFLLGDPFYAPKVLQRPVMACYPAYQGLDAVRCVCYKHN